MSVCHVVSNLASSLPRRSAVIERRKLSLSSLARRRGLNPRRQPIMAQRNGKWISQKHWRRVTAKRDDVVVFVVMPRGGGNVWRTLASLAIIVAATVIAGPFAAFLGFTGIGLSIATAVIAAGIMVGGNLLLNALIPIKPVDSGLDTQLAASDGASPTYQFSVGSQQNIARLGGSIPALYGRMRFVPDIAATPWTEWVDGFQTLHQTLLLTQGTLEVERVDMGRTPISTFEEIETELVGPGNSVSLFEPEVYQAPDVRGILLGAPNDLQTIDDGTYGPFAATPPGVSTDRIGLDIGFPRGLYRNEDDGSISTKSVAWKVEAQQINSAGAALGSWITVANETFSGAGGAVNTSSGGTFMGGGYATSDKAASPLTVSYRYTLTSSSRWQVRVTRTDTKDLSARSGHDVSWNGLRGFLGGGSYGNVTVLAVKTLATASVNDATVRQISVTGTRKLSTYDAGTQTWSAAAPTRSIAAAVADMLKNSTYGGRRADRDFDLAHLAELDATWTARGDTFDYYAAQATTLWGALGTALRAGRAVPYRQAGIVRFHRDEPQTMPQAMFSRENIVKGSFKLGIVMPSPEDETDGIEIKYFNQDVWNYDSIRLPYQGSDDPTSPKSNTLDGVVQPTQAANEAAYLLAADRYRRIFASFDTEFEGLSPSRGDLVYLAHDMPRWGQSTRVLTWDEGSRQIGLWGRPDFGDGTSSYVVRIRDARGVPSALIEVASIGDDFTITLAEAPTYTDGSPFDMDASSESEPLHIAIGTLTDVARPAIFLAATPRGGTKVSISCVLEDARVHVN